jgi:hypothetical protein
MANKDSFTLAKFAAKMPSTATIAVLALASEGDTIQIVKQSCLFSVTQGSQCKYSHCRCRGHFSGKFCQCKYHFISRKSFIVLALVQHLFGLFVIWPSYQFIKLIFFLK